MDRRLREDGTEQGSANLFLCGLPPLNIPGLPNLNFPGFNSTLLYVAPPDKTEEVILFIKEYFTDNN